MEFLGYMNLIARLSIFMTPVATMKASAAIEEILLIFELVIKTYQRKFDSTLELLYFLPIVLVIEPN